MTAQKIEPSIVLDESLVGMWFVPNQRLADAQPGRFLLWDWMAALVHEGEHFRLTWRTRYVDPRDPGADPREHPDQKNWYTATTSGRISREEAITTARELADTQAEFTRSQVEEVLMNPERDVERFIQEFSAKPWVHIKLLQ